MERAKNKILGYLPNDYPGFWKSVLLGLQHVITMFPATVLVALLVGFHVSTVLLASGVATLVALILSKWGIGKFIPLYYGSSFSYIAATIAITNASYGVPASDEFIRMAQAGIIVTGAVNIAFGALIKALGGKKAIDKVLPPIITGSVACVIGFALGFEALKMSLGNCCGLNGEPSWILVSLVTMISTMLFSKYLRGKGFIGMLPILLGAIVGYVVAIPLGLTNFSAITDAPLFVMPHITMPLFTGAMSMTAIISIAVMAIATIPESTAHLYQISLYVDELARELKKNTYNLDDHIGFNLVLDGIGDALNGLIGGVAGTNYGENNSLMAITRNYSGISLIAASLIAILLAFSGKLVGIVYSVPTAVSGGLAIYLFGVIGMQGISLMIHKKVDLFDPGQLAVGAAIFIVGIGGHIGFPGGFLPIPLLQNIFPSGWPAIATAAVLGILLNLIFTLLPSKSVE
ncbi:MAG: solute carrier family 23 protein [bacterium]